MHSLDRRFLKKHYIVQNVSWKWWLLELSGKNCNPTISEPRLSTSFSREKHILRSGIRIINRSYFSETVFMKSPNSGKVARVYVQIYINISPHTRLTIFTNSRTRKTCSMRHTNTSRVTNAIVCKWTDYYECTVSPKTCRKILLMYTN